MALNLAPEDRFALDVYSDPTLSIDEKLARLRAYGAEPANDPTAPPVNDNGLPAIPAGPGIPVEATAEVSPAELNRAMGNAVSARGFDELNAIGGTPGARQAAPPVAIDVPTGPQPFDFTQVPAFDAPPGTMPRQAPPAPAAAFQEPPAAIPGSSPAEKAALAAAEAARAGKPPPGTVDPSQVQFGDGSTAPGSAGPGGPIFAQVGTNEFQPASRTIRAGITPTTPIAGGEPEFTVDPKTGDLVITGSPPEETRLEPLITSAKQDELTAKRDVQEAREYGDAASLRADQAAEGRAQKIEDAAIKRANERAARLKKKEDEFQRVLADVTNPDHPSGQDAYFAKRETGAQFAAGLAIAFGELGAALRGTNQNTARDIIFKAIDDEIAAGRERRAARVKGAETAYDLARDQFESETLQDAAVKQMMLGRVAREAARFKQFAQTPERKAALDEQIAFWEGQELDADIQRQKLMQDEIVQQERFDPVRTVQVGGATGKDDGRIVRSHGEDVGFAPSEKRADVVQGQVDSLDALETELADLSRLTEEARGNVNPQRVDDLKKQIAAKVNLVGAAISVAQQQGAMSDDERQRMTKSLGSAEDFVNFDIDSTPRVRQTLGYFQRKKSTILRNNVSDQPKGGRAVRVGKMPGSFEGKQ